MQVCNGVAVRPASRSLAGRRVCLGRHTSCCPAPLLASAAPLTQHSRAAVPRANSSSSNVGADAACVLALADLPTAPDALRAPLAAGQDGCFAVRSAAQGAAGLPSRRQWLLQSTLSLAGSGLLGGATAAAVPGAAQAAPSSGPALLDRLDVAAADAGGPAAAPWFNKAQVLEYPRWLFGEWHVQSRPVTSCWAPQGEGYFDKAASQLEGQDAAGVVTFDVKFYSTLPDTFDNQLRVQLGQLPRDATVADRAFVTTAVADVLAGFAAVESVDYDPREGPDRVTVVYSPAAASGAEGRPALQSFQLFIKSIATHAILPPVPEYDDEGEPIPIPGAVVGAPEVPERYLAGETGRMTPLAAGGGDSAGTDYEVVTEYRRTSDPSRVLGRQRIYTAAGGAPQGSLSFLQAARPVAVYDSEFVLRREPPPADAGRAEACVHTYKGYTQCQ